METIKQILVVLDSYEEKEEMLRDEKKKMVGTLIARAVKSALISE